MKKRNALLALALFLSGLLFLLLYPTQTTYGQSSDLLLPKSKIHQKYKANENSGWVYINEKKSVKEFVNDILKEKNSLSLTASDALEIKGGSDLLATVNAKSEWSDEGVFKINQIHNGLEVEAAQLSIHYDKEGNVKLMHGKLAKKLPTEAPKLSEQQALNKALSAVNSEKYAWQAPEWEEGIKKDLEDPKATYYPKGQLIYARIKPDDDFTSTNFALAYRFKIYSLKPERKQEEVFVDAKTGQIIKKRNTKHESWGTINTLYDGTRGFYTQWRGFPNYDYVLKDQVHGEKLHTLRWDTNEWWQRPEVDDSDNNWSGPTATAHWATQVAWDFYKNTYNRNGMDGAGGKIRIEGGSSIQNEAGYDRIGGYDYLTFGRAAGSSQNGDLAAMDVVAHEFTHGITRDEAGLIYEGESGALNESFSDIFGVMGERYLDGVENWTMGEDPFPGTNPGLRSLSDPNLHSQPDTYQSPTAFWWNPTQTWFDHGGVHINSGVQNFWFFLLVNGGAGVNDLGQAYDVQGIGIVAAARIAYRSLISYMQPGSTFPDAREAAINAARDLYGECSIQLISTVNAWQAVGVGAAMGGGLCVSPLYATNSIFCAEDGYYSGTFWVTAFPQGATYTWYPPSNWDYTENGNEFYLNNIYGADVGLFNLDVLVELNGQSEWRSTSVEIIECYSYSSAMVSTEGSGLKVFPNPANSTIQLEFPDNSSPEYTLNIVDRFGTLKKTGKIKAGSTPLDVSTLDPGMYIISVSDSKRKWIYKFFVER